MGDWGSALWGAVIGALVGGMAERSFFRPVDRMAHLVRRLWGRWRDRRFLERLDVDGEFLVAGDDERVFVYQFSPTGFDLALSVVPPRDLAAQMSAVDPVLRPVHPDRVQSLVDAKRAEIERTAGIWNESKFGVTSVNVENDDTSPRPLLALALHETDFATFTTIRQAWRTASGREALARFTNERLSTAVPGLSHSLGVNATVVTADKQLILTQRSGAISSERAQTHISVNEGMTVHDLTNRRPDPVRALKRGIHEELGIPESDIPDESITIHSLILDADRYQWAFLAHVDLSRTVEPSPWTAARVRLARVTGRAADKWENGSIRTVPFSAERVQHELLDPQGWIAHGWVNLLLTAMAAFEHQRDAFLDLAITRRQ